MEYLKETIRWILFPIAVAFDGEFTAVEGSPMYHFLNWLYGNPEAIDDYRD